MRRHLLVRAAVVMVLGFFCPATTHGEAAPRPTAEHLWISVDARAVIPVAHLERIMHLVESGAIRPVLDRTFSPTEAGEAHRYIETGHKRGGIAMVFVS